MKQLIKDWRLHRGYYSISEWTQGFGIRHCLSNVSVHKGYQIRSKLWVTVFNKIKI